MTYRIMSLLIATATVTLVAPPPAAAQDATIRIRVPGEVVSEFRHVTEAVEALQGHLGRDVRDAVRLSLGELRHLTRAGDLTPGLDLDLGLDLSFGLNLVESLGDVAFALDGAQSRNFREEKTARETRQFDLGTSGVLELRNLSGNVTVTAGTGSQATVEIVRRARGRTAADAQRGLDEVIVDVTDQRGRAALVTKYPENQNRSPYSVSVTYTVRAPAGTRLTVGSVVGDVSITGIKGDLAVDVVSGDIEVLDAARVLQVKTVSGDVTLTGVDTDANLSVSSLSGDVTLRQVRAGQLSVNGVSGEIDVADVTVDSAELKTISGSLRYTGGLHGKGRYEFQTHSGDVVLVLTNATGFELEARTFNGDIRPDPSFEVGNLTANRRSLRGRVGNGDAVVVATTFSGDIVIRRR